MLGPRPEGVEVALAHRRGVPGHRGHRPRVDQHGPRTPLDAPVEFGNCLVHVGQRDDRGREDPSPIVERPFLVEPFVVGVHDGMGELDVIGHPLLQHAARGGEHDTGLDALGIEQLQAFLRAPEGVRTGNRVGQLPKRFTIRVDAAEIVRPRSGRCDDVVGGVGNRVGQLALDHELRLTVDLYPFDRALVLLRQVPGVGIGRFIQVVVGVPDLAGLGVHGRAPLLSGHYENMYSQ